MKENLDTFILDFGVEVLWNDHKFLGIFDMPDEIVSQGVVLTTDYLLTVKSSDISGLKDGEILLVKDDEYFVRHVRKIDSGDLSIISLTKGE